MESYLEGGVISKLGGVISKVLCVVSVYIFR